MRLHVGTGYVGLRHVSLEVNKRDLLLTIKQDRQVADDVSMIERGARNCYS